MAGFLRRRFILIVRESILSIHDSSRILSSIKQLVNKRNYIVEIKDVNEYVEKRGRSAN
jgi:hypothetical protein